MARGKTVAVDTALSEIPAGEPQEDLEPLDVVIDEPVAAAEDVTVDPAKVETQPVEVAPPAKEEDPVIAKLQADLRQREQELAQARGQIQSEQTEKQKAWGLQIDSAIDAENQKASQLERDLADAWAAGDTAKAANIQRQMARVEANIGRLEEGKNSLKSAPAPEVQKPSDPVEAIIAQNNISGREAEWIRSHRDAVLDQTKLARLANVARYAADEYGAGSDAYFNFIEQKMGYAQEPKPVVQQQPAQQQAPTVRKQPPVAAPVSRETSGGIGGAPRTGTKVRLSPDQRAAAKASGISDAEYAKNLMDAAKNDPNFKGHIDYV